MKPLRVVVTMLVLGGLFGVLAVAYSQRPLLPAVPMTKGDHVVSPAQQPTGAVCLGNVITNEGSRDQHRLAAGLLRAASVPPSLPAHFDSVLSDPRLQLKGWSLEILDVSSADGAAAAKVRVTPMLVGQQSVSVIGSIEETYELGDHSVRFIKSETPSPEVGVILD